MQHVTRRCFRGLLVVGLFGLGACHHEQPSRIDARALAWLPEADGTLVRFRNDTLGVQTLTVSRRRSIGKLPSKTADNPYEQETVSYGGAVFPERVLQLEAALRTVSFSLGQADGSYGWAANVQVGQRDTVQAALTRGQLLSNYTLRGRTYPYVLHLWRLPAQATAAFDVTGVYYAPDQGLLAYTTNRRQIWYRD